MERQPDTRIDALLRAINEAHDAATGNVVPIERAPSYQAPQPERPLLDQPAESGHTETELEADARQRAEQARANIIQYFEDETPPYEVPDTDADAAA